MKSLTVAGIVVDHPKITNDNNISTFTVAVETKMDEGREYDYMDIICHEELLEIVQKEVKKSAFIVVAGSPELGVSPDGTTPKVTIYAHNVESVDYN